MTSKERKFFANAGKIDLFVRMRSAFAKGLRSEKDANDFYLQRRTHADNES